MAYCRFFRKGYPVYSLAVWIPQRERSAEPFWGRWRAISSPPRALGQSEVEMAAHKPKRGPVMRTETKMSEERRQKMLSEMLTRLRDETFERVSEFRRDQRDTVNQRVGPAGAAGHDIGSASVASRSLNGRRFPRT